jgi:hypothetical protein
MPELLRGQGKDLCGRVHGDTGAECYLPDTHFPRPHQSLNGTSWHDGLCTTCAGGGTHQATLCPDCNGTGFQPLKLPTTPQPG